MIRLSGSCRWLVFLTACACAHANVLKTVEFEPAEGYAPGLLNSQVGWTATVWRVETGGVDVGATRPNTQDLQLAGPASSGERAFTTLPSVQSGVLYVRLDFRYEGTYDSSDFFWVAFSSRDGGNDTESLGAVLRSAQPNSLQFYARSTNSDGSKTNSTGYITHTYDTSHTLVLRAGKSGGGDTDPFDQIHLHVNPTLVPGSVEPASPDAQVTASIDSVSLNGFFFRVGDSNSLDTGEHIFIDSIVFATDWSDLTRDIVEPEIIGSPATTDMLSERPYPAFAADFDHDGTSDFMESALGRDPRSAGDSGPVLNVSNVPSAGWELFYDRPVDADHYAFLAERGNNLSAWNSVDVDQEAALSTAPDGRQRVTVRINRSPDLPDFLRLAAIDTRLIAELDSGVVAGLFAKILSWWSQYVNTAGTKDTYNSTTTWDYEWVMRMLVPMAAWLSQPGRSESVTWNGITVNVTDALRKALVNGTDPSHPDRWPYAANSGDQVIVEAPQVAYALWLLHEAKLTGAPGGAVWDSFSSTQLSNMQAFLEATANPSWSYYNNWNLFIVVNHEARKRLQLAGIAEFDAYSQAAVDDRLADVQGFHKGGGWYADHESDAVFDDYLPWALLPDQMVAFMMGNSDDQTGTVIPNTGGRGRSQILSDTASWLNAHVRMFDAFGGNPEYGRSNTYKFARLRAIVTAYVIDQLYNTPGQWSLGFDVLPPEIGPGGLRRLVRLHLNHYLGNGILDSLTGELRNGQTLAGTDQTLEPYTHDGSRFWAAFPIGTLLLLPDDDPLWSTPEKPLPAETHAYESWFQAPGILLRNAPQAGHLELLNARAERPSWTNTTYTPKYNKYAYSTHFGYCTASGTRLDQSISIGGGFRDNPSGGDYFLPENRDADQPGVIRTTHLQNGATVRTLIFLKDDLQVRVNRITNAAEKSVREAGYPLGSDAGESTPPPVHGPDWIYLESSDGAVMTARLHGFASVDLLSGTGYHSRKASWRLPFATLSAASATQETAILLVARRESFDPASVRNFVESVGFDGNQVTVTWGDGSQTQAEFP